MPVVAASRRNFYNDDPLDVILRPPPDESPQARQLRISQEDEARRVSMAIDATIRAERQASRKKRIVRLLLLGQSESGKSTTLRQFQRLYTPTAFREERILWRAVIQLNIVRSIRIILDAISLGHRSASPSNSPYSSPKLKSRVPGSFEYPNGRVGESSKAPRRKASGDEYGIDSDSELSGLRHDRFAVLGSPPHLEALKARLLPLRHIEALLIAKLVPPDEEEATRLMSPNQTVYPPTAAAQTYPPLPAHLVQQRQRSQSISHSRDREVFVRANHQWKGALARGGAYKSSMSDDGNGSAGNGKRPSSLEDIEADEAQQVLYSCRDDMLQLWHDEYVRDVLCGKKIRLEESPGFFLNDLDRVTSLRYIPSDDDVLRARLKTVGVAEYRFTMEVTVGRDYGAEWRIIDVGGTRSQRPTWIPFFDDADAIIFLAPISGFDQVLAEDRTVNRLEDSVLIWKDVCSNKLLASVDLILFLNKCDIFEAKLNAGIRLAKYVRSYGDRDNDFNTASKYFRSKFSAIHREHSPNPRKFYAFCTSVTDTATTSGIIASVRDMVIRRNLKQSKML